MSVHDVGSLRRRYHVLLGLRFVPTGLFITVSCVAAQTAVHTDRDRIGTAAQGIVMLFLELPSGALADALGRKPVLVLASGFSMISIAVLLVADSVVLLAAVSSLQGIFRALDSGPLQAWFIDALLDAEPDVDIERALAHSDVVICSSIGLGALLGGVVAATDGFLGIDVLVAPLVLGLAVQVVGLIALLMLMDEVRPGRGWTAARRSIVEVPVVVAGAVRLIRASPLLTALVRELSGGSGWWRSRRSSSAPGRDDVGWRSGSPLGPSITAAWVLSALGAAAAPWSGAQLGSAWPLRLRLATVSQSRHGSAAGCGLIVAYLCTYWVHGATAPVHYGMVHRAVGSSHRATVVSANSLTAQAGGATSGIVLGALADATSISTATFVAAGVLAAAAPLYLVGRRAETP